MDNKAKGADLPETSIEDLKLQLEAAKAAEYEATAALAKVKEQNTELLDQIKTGQTKIPITGVYRGYSFQANHRRIRDRNGLLCDTEKVIEAANGGDTQAIETLEWLIKNEYAYLVKVEETAE